MNTQFLSKIKSGIQSAVQRKNTSARIDTKVKAAVSELRPAKGKGRELLENIGSELRQSGDIYKDCKNPAEAAAILLGQFDRLLGQDIKNGEHQVIYKNDNSLLISLDGTFYEITGSDMRSTGSKFARNAGVPLALINTQLVKLIVEGLITFWQKHDPGYNEKANRLLQ